MILELPARIDLPAYSFVVTLEGIAYQFDLTYNERINNGVGKWMLSVSSQTGELLQGPVPVVSTWPLFNRFKNSALPPGTVFAFDSSGEDVDPGRFDLGDRVRLLYEEAV